MKTNCNMQAYLHSLTCTASTDNSLTSNVMTSFNPPSTPSGSISANTVPPGKNAIAETPCSGNCIS